MGSAPAGLSVRGIAAELQTGPWAVAAELHLPADVDANQVRATSVTHDSRQAGPGSLFCCIPGNIHDGHGHAQEAVSAGAVALLVERVQRTEPAVPQFLVSDGRRAMAPIAAAVYRHPSDDLEIFGVTGTNGKTTTVALLRAILLASSRKAEMIGTLTQTRTTPEATDLQALLAKYRDGGVRSVAMEVSSHALVLNRVDAVRFAVGVFTNFSQDHLDFHGSMEDYFRAKAALFEQRRVGVAVVNGDEAHGRLLLDAATVPTVTFHMADAEDLTLGPVSSTFRWRGVPMSLNLGGPFNVENALAAATAAVQQGITPEQIAAGLATVRSVPGRFEPVSAGQPFDVIVDYAHTPEGLRRVLQAARATLAPGGRVIVVFGCGGDRDQTKRPLMGAYATELADLAILTNDNPRFEDPQRILDDARRGVKRTEVLTVEPDRRAAIAHALAVAQPGDVVVLSGKGHETGQEIAGVVYDFDDRAVASEILSGMGT